MATTDAPIGARSVFSEVGGRRVPVRRPRVRSVEDDRELAVPAYELFSSTDLLERMAMERMLAKLSSRRYRLGLEPVGVEIEQSAKSTSKSAVSRPFARATERAVAEAHGRRRLGVSPTLRSTLRSTNAIESMIEICRDHSRNVKRWRDGEMVVRWCAAGMLEAAKQFRPAKGHLHLRTLRAELDAHFAVTPIMYNNDEAAA